MTDGTSRKPDSAEPTGREWLFEDDYVYNSDTDIYVTFLRCAPKPIVIPGAKHRAMAQAYSNWDGQPASINEICRNFGMPRAWFTEYKKRHNWTHDKEPFTEEEMVSRDPDEMVEDAIEMRRLVVHQKFEKRKWHEIKKAADKWWAFEEHVYKPLEAILKVALPKYKPPVIHLQKSKNPFAVVLPPYDLHYGKGAWRDETGAGYTRKEAKELLLGKTQDILSQIARHGRPEKIITTAGSDWFHVDTDQGTTTNGTPQDMDGSPAQIIEEGSDLAVMHVDLMRQVAPVEVILVPGNHDFERSISLARILKAWFRNDKDVKVDATPHPRHYTFYGQTLLGFAHGNDVKKTKLGALMASEARELWGQTKHRALFVGHLHSEEVTEDAGVVVYQVQSLGGHDRWHARKGYVLARRALMGYMIDKEQGVIANLIAPVKK